MNVEVGGRGVQKKTLELEDIDKTEITIVTNKECRLQKQKATTQTNPNLNAQNWQHKRKVLS